MILNREASHKEKAESLESNHSHHDERETKEFDYSALDNDATKTLMEATNKAN